MSGRLSSNNLATFQTCNGFIYLPIENSLQNPTTGFQNWKDLPVCNSNGFLKISQTYQPPSLYNPQSRSSSFQDLKTPSNFNGHSISRRVRNHTNFLHPAISTSVAHQVTTRKIRSTSQVTAKRPTSQETKIRPSLQGTSNPCTRTTSTHPVTSKINVQSQPANQENAKPVNILKIATEEENQRFILDTMRNLSAIFDGNFEQFLTNPKELKETAVDPTLKKCDNLHISKQIEELRKEYITKLKMNNQLLMTPDEIERAFSDEVWRSTYTHYSQNCVFFKSPSLTCSKDF